MEEPVEELDYFEENEVIFLLKILFIETQKKPFT